MRYATACRVAILGLTLGLSLGLSACQWPVLTYAPPPGAPAPTAPATFGYETTTPSASGQVLGQRTLQNLWQPVATAHGAGWQLAELLAREQLDQIIQTTDSGRTHSWFMRDYQVTFTANSPLFYTGQTNEQCRDGIITLKTSLGDKTWRSLFCKPVGQRSYMMVVPE